MLDKFLEERGVTHTTIPPYHAQANPVERVNRTKKTMSYLENSHRDWDLQIPELRYAYNTAVQESTGWSPAFLNFGRQPPPPISLRRREEGAAEEHAESADIENWLTRMLALPDVQQIAADNAKATSTLLQCGPYTIAAQLGPNVYEVVNQEGKSAGKVHVEVLKPFHEKAASEENSEGEQAEASPSEISEERNASPTSHSANAEAPEVKAHPRPRGRPR